MSGFNKMNSKIITEHRKIQDVMHVLKEKGYKVEITAEVTTYNPFDNQLIKNKEIKTIIRDFVAADSVAELVADDSNVRLIMWDLLKELAKKDDNVELNEVETALFFVLLKDISDISKQGLEYEYSDELVNAFKTALLTP
ncbi:hypothetical protein CHH61_03855 [Shouchella clausii]|jgi:hypothetical protein|uniref:Uncharacterized protein n=1 Tax=Shouchella clausii TaxID=79880 RepID=A0A268S4C4_SHOCL|nr:hypothetical protein [Shouchella clausii]PAF27365.1 hypothetical protein CHH61_03855 [Shouchella clausii]